MALSCSVRLTDRGTDCLFTEDCTEDSQRGQTQRLAHKDGHAYYLVERFRFLKLRAPPLEHKPLGVQVSPVPWLRLREQEMRTPWLWLLLLSPKVLCV